MLELNRRDNRLGISFSPVQVAYHVQTHKRDMIIERILGESAFVAPTLSGQNPKVCREFEVLHRGGNKTLCGNTSGHSSFYDTQTTPTCPTCYPLS